MQKRVGFYLLVSLVTILLLIGASFLYFDGVSVSGNAFRWGNSIQKVPTIATPVIINTLPKTITNTQETQTTSASTESATSICNSENLFITFKLPYDFSVDYAQHNLRVLKSTVKDSVRLNIDGKTYNIKIGETLKISDTIRISLLKIYPDNSIQVYLYKGNCKDYCLNQECLNEKNLNLLIITRPMFISTLENSGYLKWKNDNNLKTGVFTVEWIMKNYQGDFIAQKIKAFIQDYNSKKGAKYAILIGDAYVKMEDVDALSKETAVYAGSNLKPIKFNIVRTKKVEIMPNVFVTDMQGINPLYIENTLKKTSLSYSWEVPTDFYPREGMKVHPERGLDYLPSDIPYSSTFNLEKGEASATHENQPDSSWKERDNGAAFIFPVNVYVARMPVRTTKELNNILKKTINYPIIKKFSFISFNISDLRYDSSYGKYYPITQKVLDTEYARPVVDTLGYITWIEDNKLINSEKYMTDSSSDGMDPTYNSALQAKNKILNAESNTYLIEQFHGWFTGFVFYYDSNHENPLDFKDSDALMFKNVFSVFDSKSCAVSAFFAYNYEPTISEAIIRAQKGPIVFIQGPLNQYFYFKALLEGKTIGEAFYAGSNYYVYGPNPYQLFGDPTLVLYNP